MRINTQFPVAVHILALLACFPDEEMPSEFIASSVGTNPVVVRRIISLLRNAGLVETKPGVKGAVLRKPPASLSLLEIFAAVRQENDTLFTLHQNPHPACTVGGRIADALTQPLAQAQKAMEKELGGFTLQDVLDPIQRQQRHRRK